MPSDRCMVQVLANRIAATQAGPSGFLSNRQPVAEMPSSDYASYRHVDHSFFLLLQLDAGGVVSGSKFDANYAVRWCNSTVRVHSKIPNVNLFCRVYL